MTVKTESSLARDLRTIPNLISLSRIVLVLIACSIYLLDWRKTALGLGTIAGITDYLDGYLARRLGLVTRLGEILDQFSDLIFEALVLLMLVSEPGTPFTVLYLAVYLVRELWVTTIRRYMAERRFNIASSIWGKLKTNFICWGFVVAFTSRIGFLSALDPYVEYLGHFGLSCGLLFGYISALSYTRQFIAAYDRPEPVT